MFFTATGVTGGDLLRGVRYSSGGAHTQWIVKGSSSSGQRFQRSCAPFLCGARLNSGMPAEDEVQVISPQVANRVPKWLRRTAFGFLLVLVASGFIWWIIAMLGSDTEPKDWIGRRWPWAPE